MDEKTLFLGSQKLIVANNRLYLRYLDKNFAPANCHHEIGIEKIDYSAGLSFTKVRLICDS